MAILDKPDIQLLVDAYTIKVDAVIVANGVGAITGPILNDVLKDSIEILTDIKDSYYNLLSETRTALSTTYDNTATNSLWTVPAPVNEQEAIDKLITSVSTNPSDNVAYVDSIKGVDTTAEIGNPLKPFLLIQSAVDAVPTANSMVLVAPGTYSSGVNTTKSNFILDIRGCIINNIIVLNYI